MRNGTIALGLSLVLMAAPAWSQQKSDTPKQEPAPKADVKSDTKPAKKQNAEKTVPAQQPPAYDPKTVDFGKLPKPIPALHICATGVNKVDFGSVHYAKSTLFVVSCPAARGKLTPFGVYVAADAGGRAAKRVIFEALALDGSATTFDTLFSVAPAREAFSETGDPVPNKP